MQQPAVNVMVKAARAGGNVLLRNMHKLDALNVVEKERMDYASEVDGLAEEAIIKELRRANPDYAILGEEGGLPVDDLPRTPGGKIIREAADEEFVKYQAEAEAAPDDWRSWFRLSCAYDASGDRKRARATMRKSISLFREGQKQGA